MDKNFMYKFKHIFSGRFETVAVRLISSWCFSALTAILVSKEDFMKPAFFDSISLTMMICCFAGAFFSITILDKLFRTVDVDAVCLGLFSLSYVCACAAFTSSLYLCLGLLIPTGLCVYYLMNRCKERISLMYVKDKTARNWMIGLAVFVFLFIGVLTALRYFTFSAPNFDFGLFAQMFHYMKETFIQYTTAERDKLLSHMAIHISPILYVLLPVYWVFPHPVTLQIAQAALLASALIPLYLLCRHYKLSGKTTIAVMIMTAFLPALAGGCFYDFHENAFLTPLMLWMLYFAEKEKYLPMYLFMLLTMLVKEDAPMYIAFIALYFIFSGRKKKHGAIMFVCAVGYFLFATWLLNRFGEGVMTNRYNNYYTENSSGLIDVVLGVFKNPAYVIAQCMTEEKLLFAAQMLLPMLCMPVLNKKWAQYILAGPFILINLMPNYTYQHSIYFQYVYGVIALFAYVTVLNLSQMKPQTKRIAAPMAAVFAVVLFIHALAPKLTYITRYAENREDYKQMRQALDIIPDDGEVTCSTFLLAYLSQRDVLYQTDYTEHETEYVAVDLRYKADREYLKNLDKTQFNELVYIENLVAVYQRID